MIPEPARQWVRMALIWSLVRLAVFGLLVAMLLQVATLLGWVHWE